MSSRSFSCPAELYPSYPHIQKFWALRSMLLYLHLGKEVAPFMPCSSTSFFNLATHESSLLSFLTFTPKFFGQSHPTSLASITTCHKDPETSTSDSNPLRLTHLFNFFYIKLCLSMSSSIMNSEKYLQRWSFSDANIPPRSVPYPQHRLLLPYLLTSSLNSIQSNKLLNICLA